MLSEFLIVCPLVFMAGFVDAVAGGGGLISVPAYLLAGLPVHHAIGTNKLSSGMGTALATYRFAKNGYINWKRAFFCVIAAMIGGSLGAHIALLITDRIFKIIMLFILPPIALYVMRGKVFDESKSPLRPRTTTMISMVVAFVVGTYDGFYGPGTGTFLILLLTSIACMKLSEANGIAKVINLTTNLSSLVVYLMNGKVILLLGLVAGCFSLVGNYLGTKVFEKKGVKSVKPLMVTVLTIFFVKVIVELVQGA